MSIQSTSHLHPIDTVEDITPARLRHCARILVEQGREEPARLVGLCADYAEAAEAKNDRWQAEMDEANKKILRQHQTLRAVGELPEKWRGLKPSHDFGNGITISYGGPSADDCADELEALLK